MKSKQVTIKTVRDLKKYLSKFGDSLMLSDICIKQVKPTKFNFTICCSIMLNEDDSDDAAKMVEQTLREVYS